MSDQLIRDRSGGGHQPRDANAARRHPRLHRYPAQAPARPHARRDRRVPRGDRAADRPPRAHGRRPPRDVAARGGNAADRARSRCSSCRSSRTWSAGLGEERLRVEIRVTTEVPPAIHADAARLRQVLTNLVENALKYSPDDRRVTLAVGGDGSSIVVRRDRPGSGDRPARGRTDLRAVLPRRRPSLTTTAPAWGSRSPGGWPRRWGAGSTWRRRRAPARCSGSRSLAGGTEHPLDGLAAA